MNTFRDVLRRVRELEERMEKLEDYLSLPSPLPPPRKKIALPPPLPKLTFSQKLRLVLRSFFRVGAR